MPPYPGRSVVIQSVLLSLILQACVENPSYAPVTTNSQIISDDEQNQPGLKVIDNTPSESSQPPRTVINTTEPIPYPNLVDSTREMPSAAVSREQKDQDDRASNPVLIPEQGKYHTVRKGETLFSIGVNSGLGHQQLMKWNNISVPYAVEVGQKIKLFTNKTADVYKKRRAKHEYSTEIEHKKTKTSFISVANNKSSHFEPTAKKTRHFVSTVKSRPVKVASISIDNKKMLKLAFQWPIKGVVVKNFQQSKNKGIDIAGKMGQTIRAAEAGKVIYGGSWLVGFGNLLIIKHDSTYLSAYANNSHLFVKEGQRVSKGQVVAQVGRMPSRKAALHFEIRKNGKSVNPLRLLPSL
ncbi:Peptidase M23 (modular protein) [Crenothrix polyspora]|uniref:Peptidase M23 (Modular protein) n=1 Tax=Crenothrix polyspora TaxID=360316 RepID=A0A1R4HHI5_9GAMM|nr:peptidoglycan DD-metalloendopeptidase family protein [Crenothrix polyspora]SJM95683.1 Peptidase M23 (modular protein) [Crenothrix polyspora]